MKGSILDFSVQTNSGVISGDDGQRYNFSGTEWRSEKSPSRGDRVDFDTDATGQAVQVYTALGHNTSPVQAINNQLDKLSNQNQSEENFNMIDWFVKCLKNYVTFSGRARRKEFWFFMLMCILIGIAAQIIDRILGTGQLIDGLINLALILPSLAVGARRLHDTGRSGWWQLLVFTVIGLIPLIIWWATDTKKENNQWGNPAK